MVKLLILLAIAIAIYAPLTRAQNLRSEQKSFDLLETLLKMLITDDPSKGVQQLEAQGLGQIVNLSHEQNLSFDKTAATISDALPVVQMHGMGDFAKNPAGMVPLGNAISDYLGGAYVLNVQIGANSIADILNGFIMNLDDQVDYFANVIQNDDNLVNGFNAVGYSQGNLVIRGYIERYNSPPVFNFISMHGPLSGVGGFPGCAVDHTVCLYLAELLGKFAYLAPIQQHLAQANYYRDPMNIEKYLAGDIFLTDINNEKDTTTPVYSTNWASLNSVCLVKANGDTVVIPNDSEWFQFFEDGTYDSIWGFEETPWYVNDYFGLKTLNEAGHVYFNTTDGDHLDFSTDYLLNLVGIYFT